MNEHEIERIAAAMHHMRPDWPTASLRTLLGRPDLSNRPRRDVAVALAWVACEADTKTPARVLENGPWWRAAVIEDGATHHHVAKVYGWHEGDPRDICSICALDRAECHRRAKTSGHEFVPRTNCLPPIDHGVAIGAARREKACGAAILGGSSCRLKTGHEGDHAMTAHPARCDRQHGTDTEEAS